MKHSLLLAALTLTLTACALQNIQPDEDAQMMGKRVMMEWYAYNEGEDAMGIPQNRLVLKTGGVDIVELYETRCAGTTQVADIPDLDAVSSTYIRCWWAGGGEDFAVFIGEAESATVRHRTVDEEAGFGPWKDLKTL
jgi:hypothetical protein